MIHHYPRGQQMWQLLFLGNPILWIFQWPLPQQRWFSHFSLGQELCLSNLASQRKLLYSHVNPLGFPSKFWRFKFERQNNESRNEPGKFHLITLTKQRKLNLDRSPCEEDPSYSFATCTKEKLSEKIGCRLPWDRWSKQDRKVCNSTTEFEQFEQIYAKLNLAESDEIEKIVGCKKPCNYNEFKFVFGIPETLPGQPNAVAFWAASSKTFTEEEVLLYPLTSFIAEFGGALGLFLGFSFVTIWQEIRGWFS